MEQQLVRPMGRKVLNPSQARKKLRKRLRATQIRRNHPTAWVRSALIKMIKSGDYIAPLGGSARVVITNNSALKHNYGSLRELLVSAKAAVAGGGGSDKYIGAADGNDTAITIAGLSLTAAIYTGYSGATGSEGKKTWGWFVTITGSDNAFPKRPIPFSIGPIVGASGTSISITTPVVSGVIYPRGKTPIYLVILSVANAGGVATIITGGSGQVGGSASLVNNGLELGAVDANTFANFESLNERDLVNRLDPSACRDEEGSDEDEDETWLDEFVHDGLVRDGGTCYDLDGEAYDC